MRSQVEFLIVHGAHGTPQENWFPWLASELQKYGRVRVPQFPTPTGQNLGAWRAIADAALAGYDPENTVLIGHSSGAVFVLRMAEKTARPFKAIFSACPFARDLGLAEFDPLNSTFVHPAFAWEKVARGTKRIVCFAGDNDPYVPLSRSKEVADAIRAELIVIPKGGHLNSSTGFDKFPQLLEKIKESL